MIKIIAIIGKAGSGKDTILNRIFTLYSTYFHKIISCTSRPPREKEIKGKDYYFYTKEHFLNKINNNEMLEYTEFNNWLYGTSLDSVSKDKINIGVFNPQGIENLLKRNDIDLKIIYVRASAKERLLRQLNREENPNVEEIIRRFNVDEQDFNNLNYKAYVIDNSDIDVIDLDDRIKCCLTSILPWTKEDNLYKPDFK